MGPGGALGQSGAHWMPAGTRDSGEVPAQQVLWVSGSVLGPSVPRGAAWWVLRGWSGAHWVPGWCSETRGCPARTQWVLGGCLVLLSILWVPGSWGLRVCRVSALGAVPPPVPPELLRDAPASGPGQAFSFSSLASPCWLCTSSCARPLLWPRPFRWCLPLPASGSCLAPHALGIAASPG